MIQRDQFNGGDAPFQGDRILRLRSIPANARILRATVTVEPVDARGPQPLFTETIRFSADGAGDFGATRRTVSGTPFWAEVDFHARQTPVQVTGSDLNTATLQVDMGGGVYVEINKKGAFKSPPPDDAFQISNGNTAALPILTVTKLKLTREGAPAPSLASVTIHTVPSNLSLRAGTLAPFWTHLGDLTARETSPDFAAVLQAFLITAPVENGFYNVPIALHSDTLARLQITFEIDQVSQQTAIPNGLKEVVQVFDVGTLPPSNADVLSVEIPPNSRIVPAQTSARVRGAFAETRIVYPLPAGGAVRSDAAVEVSPNSTQAQPVSFDTQMAATALDLLLEPVDRTVRLRLDLHGDLDGKPDEASLLPGPVVFNLEKDAAKPLNWVSVPLPTEFHFQDNQHVKRYWILLQSLEGKTNWSVARARTGDPGAQSTQDGGLSWRSATVSPDFRPNLTGPFTAFFRLRRVPEHFQVPIELQIGKDDQAVRVKLDRFAPLGRVDFVPDAELAKGFSDYLANSAGNKLACPETEHLANGDFKQWAVLGDQLGAAASNLNLDNQVPPLAVAVSPDGRYAYVLRAGDPNSRLELIDVLCDKSIGSVSLAVAKPVTFAIHPDGARAFVSTSAQIFVVNLASGTSVGPPFEIGAASMAFSPDGGQLFVVGQSAANPIAASVAPLGVLDTAGAPAAVRVRSFDPPILATAVAVLQDGSRLVVTNADTKTIQIVDAASGALIGAPVPVDKPGVIAVSPDGKRAFVASPVGVTVVNLDRGLVLKSTITVAVPISLAVTPHGDRVYLAAAAAATTGTGGQVQYIPIGTRQPAEWSPAGLVKLNCASVPSQIAVDLGGSERSVSTLPSPVPASLSQVVPVSSSCPYDFRFLGRTTPGSDAVAEVFWLSQCKPLKTDTVPIAVAGQLVQHQARLIAPEGAVQAEVRFRVPAQQATIAAASFGATAEALQNGTLVLQGPGLIANWTFAPQPAAGFVASASDGGLQLQNGGAVPVDLSQSIPVKNKRNFALEVQARNTGQPSETNPRVELRWLDANGQPAGDPSVLDGVSSNFGRLATKGAVPAQASQAEVHLLVPPASALQVGNISLRFPETVSVPVTFIAHAPGELHVSDIHVAFEPLPVSMPPAPLGGLCAPTPPDRKPGELPEDCCFCSCCGTEQKMIAPQPAVTHSGRPATLGACPTCGNNIVRFGGTLISGATLVPLVFLPTPALVRVPALIPISNVPLTVDGGRPFANITGIGDARTQQLVSAGIDSVEKLAAARPETVAEILRVVNLDMATGFIDQARKLRVESNATKDESRLKG